MTTQGSAGGLDLDGLAVTRARRGEWPGIRTVLKDAIAKIERAEPIHEGGGIFLAEALEKAMAPGQDTFAEAARLLRQRQPLPSEIAPPVQSFLKRILSKMREAMVRQQEELSENPPKDCSAIFAPNSPTHHFLDLEPHVATAFRLRREADRGGRPQNSRLTDQFFNTFDTLRGYGANKTQAQAILAQRFGVTARTIQRKLEQRPLSSLERRGGEIVLVLHEPGEPRPERPLEEGPAPYEPYLKARLATAVANLQEDGASLEQACERVAEEFGLHVEAELFGTKIVERAVKQCEENRSGWARVPLAVCRHELGRRPRTWPTRKSIAESRSLAAGQGESPAAIDAASRDLGSGMPKHQAVTATVDELGLSYELVQAMCRERIEFETKE